MKNAQEKIIDHDQAIADARWILKNRYFVLDTETTGLGNDAQICQIGMVYYNGKKYKSLVKPTVPIEREASNIHHIIDKDVENAPNITEVVGNIPEYGMFVAYNTPFDMRILKQSLLAYGNIYNEKRNTGIYDVMKIYAALKGELDNFNRDYKWYKLEIACKQSGIEVDLELHDALADAIVTERLLKYIASQDLLEATNGMG
jgi:DNA polymerase III subunit epsilon